MKQGQCLEKWQILQSMFPASKFEYVWGRWARAVVYWAIMGVVLGNWTILKSLHP